MHVVHGTFTPLIFPVTGGAGPQAQLFHKHLALKISTKTGKLVYCYNFVTVVCFQFLFMRYEHTRRGGYFILGLIDWGVLGVL